MKKTLALVLALCALLGLCGCSAGGFGYSKERKTVESYLEKIRKADKDAASSGDYSQDSANFYEALAPMWKKMTYRYVGEEKVEGLTSVTFEITFLENDGSVFTQMFSELLQAAFAGEEVDNDAIMVKCIETGEYQQNTRQFTFLVDANQQIIVSEPFKSKVLLCGVLTGSEGLQQLD